MFSVYRIINGVIMATPEASFTTRKEADAFCYSTISRQYIVVEDANHV